MAPSLSFRGQPFGEEDTAGAFLARTLADAGIESLTVVVAWARFGGLRRLKPQIEAFRGRGGRLRLIVGIDEGIATMPGLMLAIDLAAEAHVFHDRGARTFHPKLFLAEGPEKALILVGSSNLTSGGLFSNYEASLEAVFELPGEETAEALRGVRDYVRLLMEDENLCRPLDGSLLDRLLEDPRYAISKRERRADRSEGQAGEDLFGTSRHEKVSAPGLTSEAREELGRIEAEAPEEPVEATGAVPPPAAPEPVATWTKVLRASDAQHPPSSTSNPLGNLRLTKSVHPIDWRTWFRNEMFGDETWVAGRDRKGNPKETAIVPFAVTIDGRSLGAMELEVDHAPHRESGQGNHATVLHWGELLPILRDTDYKDCTVKIQRVSDGTYRLDISK